MSKTQRRAQIVVPDEESYSRKPKKERKDFERYSTATKNPEVNWHRRNIMQKANKTVSMYRSLPIRAAEKALKHFTDEADKINITRQAKQVLSLSPIKVEKEKSPKKSIFSRIFRSFRVGAKKGGRQTRRRYIK